MSVVTPDAIPAKPAAAIEPVSRPNESRPIRNVKTPIANDTIGAQITRYKQNYITFEEFLQRIQYPKGITFQYAFCTQKAIDQLIKQ